MLENQLIFAFVGLLTFGSFNLIASDDQLGWAVNELSTTKPIPSPWDIPYLSDPQQRDTESKLYLGQLKAIAIVTENKPSKTAKLLIPFLDYSIPGFFPYVLGTPFINNVKNSELAPVSLDVVRSQWPVLNALLEIPGSSRDLKEFALDSNNSLSFRFAALEILRNFPESKDFRETLSKFHTEFDNRGPEAKELLSNIEKGNEVYRGAIIPGFDVQSNLEPFSALQSGFSKNH